MACGHRMQGIYCMPQDWLCPWDDSVLSPNMQTKQCLLHAPCEVTPYRGKMTSSIQRDLTWGKCDVMLCGRSHFGCKCTVACLAMYVVQCHWEIVRGTDFSQLQLKRTGVGASTSVASGLLCPSLGTPEIGASKISNLPPSVIGPVRSSTVGPHNVPVVGQKR